MNKKKVLCITRKYPPIIGGMENFCYHVYTGLESDNIETKIIALGKKQKNLLWWFPYTVFYVIFNIHKYDAIILGDSLLCFLGVLARLLSKKTKRIIIVYGLDILYKNRLYQIYLKVWLKKCADTYVSISKETAEALKNKGIRESVIITPGIDTDVSEQVCRFERRDFLSKYNINEKDVVLITVGRLVKRKGVAWFVNSVMPAFKKHHIKYLIIGEGGERANIQEAIHKNHLEDKVLMLGRISDEDLSLCYKYSDIFVMPNIHVDNDMEGFGIVAVEASLNELIVVASDIEGITDAVINEKNGYLIESQNKEQYINKINDIYNNLEMYKKNTKSFSQYTRKYYSWDEICKEYQKLITE